MILLFYFFWIPVLLCSVVALVSLCISNPTLGFRTLVGILVISAWMIIRGAEKGDEKLKNEEPPC